MVPASLNRSRAALALEMANAATTPRGREGYMSLWRDWTASAEAREARDLLEGAPRP